jgi:membrane-associated HD superfamily phosphohydrolase
MMSIIKKCWRGEEKLWKVFWLYWLLLSIVIILLIYAVAAFSPSSIERLRGVSLLFGILYMFGVLISAWRCAWNCVWKGWGYFVRILAIPMAILLLIGMLGAVDAPNSFKLKKCVDNLFQQAAANGIDPVVYVKQHQNECFPPESLE